MLFTIRNQLLGLPVCFWLLKYFLVSQVNVHYVHNEYYISKPFIDWFLEAATKRHDSHISAPECNKHQQPCLTPYQLTIDASGTMYI